MYFYKETLEDGSVRYCMTNLKRTEPNFEEITQEEYESATAWEWEECTETFSTDETSNELSYDELLAKNTELEKENAVLLFQVLTGEEYADV